jgi:hypothetical protein
MFNLLIEVHEPRAIASVYAAFVVVHPYHCPKRGPKAICNGGSTDRKIRRMSPNDYEIFRRRVFDELVGLQHADRQRILIDLVQSGQRCDIDVITEIVNKQRPASEVMAEVKRKHQEIHRSSQPLGSLRRTKLE